MIIDVNTMDPEYEELRNQTECYFEAYIRGETIPHCIQFSDITSPDLFERLVKKVLEQIRDNLINDDTLGQMFIQMCRTDNIPFIRILLSHVTFDTLVGNRIDKFCNSLINYSWIDLIEFFFCEVGIPILPIYLHRAIIKKRHDCIDFLLNHGADVNVVACKNGKFLLNPVSCACRDGDKNLIMKLINCGAEFTLKEGRKKLPLQHAADADNYSVLSYVFKVYPHLIEGVEINHERLIVHYVVKRLSKRSSFRSLFMRISCQ